MNRILIIENNLNYAKILSHKLEKEGFETKVCLSGMAALDYTTNESRIDLIILDLKLPDLDGLVLLEKLKAQLKIPVVINSGYPYHKQEISSWLADAFVNKSSEFNELKEIIHSLFKKQ